jgi:hypothetical protein
MADFWLRKAGEKALSHKKIEKNNDGRDVFLDNKALIIIIFGDIFKTNC